MRKLIMAFCTVVACGLYAGLSERGVQQARDYEWEKQARERHFEQENEKRFLADLNNAATNVLPASKTKIIIKGRNGQDYIVDAVRPEERTISFNDVIKAMKARNERAAAREQQKHDDLLAAQPVLKGYVEELFSKLDFNAQRNVYVDRRMVTQATDIKIEVKHFAFPHLKQQIAQKNWLAVLNITYDIIHGNSDFTNHYEMFPEQEEILNLCSLLCQYNFRTQWTVPKSVDIVAGGDGLEDVLKSFCNKYRDCPRIHQAHQVEKSICAFPIFSDLRLYLGYADGKVYGKQLSKRMYFWDYQWNDRYAHCPFTKRDLYREFCRRDVAASANVSEDIEDEELIKLASNNSKYEIPEIAAIEMEICLLFLHCKNKEIAMSEYENGMSRVYDKFEKALEKTFIRLSSAITADSIGVNMGGKEKISVGEDRRKDKQNSKEDKCWTKEESLKANNDMIRLEKETKAMVLSLKSEKTQLHSGLEPRVRLLIKIMKNPVVAELCNQYTGVDCNVEFDRFKTAWRDVEKQVSTTNDSQGADDLKGIEDRKKEIENLMLNLKSERGQYVRAQRRMQRLPPRVAEIDQEIRALEKEKINLSYQKVNIDKQRKKEISATIKARRDELYIHYKALIYDDLKAAIKNRIELK